MRIDEFSNAAGIDGSISAGEQTSFLLFGFDIELREPVAMAIFFEQLLFNSLITKTVSFDGLITMAYDFNSPIVKSNSQRSLITTEASFNSPLEN